MLAKDLHQKRLALLCELGDIEREMEGSGNPPLCPTQHAALLSYVKELGEVRNGDVSRAFVVRSASATGMLQRAVAAGFLRGKRTKGGARYEIDPNGHGSVSSEAYDGWPNIAC